MPPPDRSVESYVAKLEMVFSQLAQEDADAGPETVSTNLSKEVMSLMTDIEFDENDLPHAIKCMEALLGKLQEPYGDETFSKLALLEHQRHCQKVVRQWIDSAKPKLAQQRVDAFWSDLTSEIRR